MNTPINDLKDFCLENDIDYNSRINDMSNEDFFEMFGTDNN